MVIPGADVEGIGNAAITEDYKDRCQLLLTAVLQQLQCSKNKCDFYGLNHTVYTSPQIKKVQGFTLPKRRTACIKAIGISIK